MSRHSASNFYYSSPGKKIRRQMSSFQLRSMNVKAGEHRRSELCDLHVTISARYDWPVACLFHYVIGISGILPYKRNVTLQTFLSITRDFFRLDNTLARLYNAAASPASRLRSAGSLAITSTLVCENCKRNIKLLHVVTQHTVLLSLKTPQSAVQDFSDFCRNLQTWGGHGCTKICQLIHRLLTIISALWLVCSPSRRSLIFLNDK